MPPRLYADIPERSANASLTKHQVTSEEDSNMEFGTSPYGTRVLLPSKQASSNFTLASFNALVSFILRGSIEPPFGTGALHWNDISSRWSCSVFVDSLHQI